MKITEELVDYLADLARLTLPAGEKEEIVQELGQILDYMAVLDTLDTGGVEPLSHIAPLNNVLRLDEVVPSTGRAALLAGAPATDGETFLTPQAVE